MSLLKEIQAAAIDSTVSIETLLRQCRILASRLKHDELKQWVQRELDGYEEEDSLPSYRKAKGHCFGHFSGPFGSGMRNAPIPTMCIPEQHREDLTSINVRQGVAGLLQLVEAEGDLHIPWPADATLVFGEKIYQGQNLIEGWIAISSAFIAGILSTIRNRVLNFALEIEEQNPQAGEAPIGSTPIPKENVSQIFNNYIYGNVSNVASGHSISQTATMNVSKGDLASLIKILESQDLPEEPISELKTVLENEVPNSPNALGPKASNWIGKMVAKAAEGTWKMSTTVAANMLTSLIKSYYGMP